MNGVMFPGISSLYSDRWEKHTCHCDSLQQDLYGLTQQQMDMGITIEPNIQKCHITIINFSLQSKCKWARHAQTIQQTEAVSLGFVFN